MSTELQPKRRIHDRDVAAIAGLDPHRGPWSVWAELRGLTPAPPPPTLGTLALPAWRTEWIDGRYLGPDAPCRAPTGTACHASLPLDSDPDFVVPKAEAWGPKWGIGFIVPLTHRTWRNQWNRDGVIPVPDAGTMARAQAGMLATRAHWTLIVPIVTPTHFEAPIAVPRDETLQDHVARLIDDLWTSVRNDDPPCPEPQTDRDAMAALAAARGPDPQLRVADETEAATIRQLLERYDAAETAAERARAGIDDAITAARTAKAELERHLLTYGAVIVDDTKLHVHATRPAPRRHNERFTTIRREQVPSAPATTANTEDTK